VTGEYTYDARTWDEVERMCRDALPGGSVLKPATLAEDFGGIDATYSVNHRCALQIRTRHNRPAWASDSDITFRDTEPAMIAAGTYAPLLLFCWLRGGFGVAGKLIDIYRMAERVDPPLHARLVRRNFNGNHGFLTVTIAELHTAGALLRQGDRDSWATATLGGQQRLERILNRVDQ
jgi:hypothetical protein